MQARNSSDTRTPHFADPLAFNAPDGGTGFPGTIAVKFCTQRMPKVQNGEEIAESFNPLSKAHERYRQTDNRRIAIADSNVTFESAIADHVPVS